MAFMNFIQKIKEIFFRRRGVSFLFLGFFVFFLFSLPLPASAGVWDILVGAVTAVPTLIAVVLLAFVLFLTQIFAFLAGALLNWVVSPSFVAVSYTSPVDRGSLPGNPIIQVGLDITKNFVNLGLVVALVYIAVSIALRLGETDAKKMLARLILIALLVNFAPVLVGLIVDASNIVMNFFLRGVDVSISDVLTQFSVWGNGLVTKLLRVPTFAGQMGLIAQTVVMIVLNISIGVFCLMYGVLFMFRYIAIWTLVILSPLAFVSWILPATKKYWDMWWNQLIQWSVIGVPIAFFLYLGARAFEVLPTIYKQPVIMAGFTPDVAGAFSQAFPYFVVLAFLYLGFTVGLQTSAMGAGQIIGWSKKGGWAAAKWTGSQSRRLAGRIAGDKGKKWMQRQASTKMTESFGRGRIGRAVSKVLLPTGITPTFWALRRGVGEAGLHLTEAGRKDIRGAEKKYEGTTAENKVTAMRDIRFGWGNRIAALKRSIEEEQIDDVKRIMGPTADEEITKIGRASLRVHPDEFKEIRNAFPHLAEQMGQGFTEETRRAAKVHPQQAIQEGYASVQEGITARLKPNQIIKMDISQYYPDPITRQVSQAGQEIRAAMHTFWTGEQLGTAGRTFGRRFLTEFQNTINQQGAGWYNRHNPRLLQYLNSQAGQGLGLTPPP